VSLAIVLIIMASLIGRLIIKIVHPWFLYLLILVFLGGVIILIIYMRTLSANEKFTPLNIPASALAFPVPLYFVATYHANHVPLRINCGPMTSIYEANHVRILFFLIVYLLIALVCIVKLVIFEEGPLIKRL